MTQMVLMVNHKVNKHTAEQTELENVAIANALQLEATRAAPALCRFNYDAISSLMSPNLSIAVL